MTALLRSGPLTGSGTRTRQRFSCRVDPYTVVSRRLGHADVHTTLDRYSWVTEDEELRSVADWKIVAAKWRAADEGS